MNKMKKKVLMMDYGGGNLVRRSSATGRLR